MQSSAPAVAWGLPFAGLLASMAVFPIVAPRFWHRRMGGVAFAWSIVLVLCQATASGPGAAAAAAVRHALLI
ncbi:MAG: sodium:proton antiporter, partial [Acetobacteraceae bacterium]